MSATYGDGDEPGDPIETAASEWLARRDRGFAPEEAEAFARWRAADPRHEAMVRELSALWGALDDLVALRGQTQGSAFEVEGEVTMFRPLGRRGGGRDGSEPRKQVCSYRGRSRRWWPMLAMAAGLAVIAGMFWLSGDRQTEVAASRYQTPVGGQRLVTLPDGSEVRLNTDSAIEVRFAAGERRVRLERGEAFFAVANDPARPFVVRAADTEARVLGTAFVVRLHAHASELLVAEGRVQFGAAAGAKSVVAASQHAMCPALSAAAPRVTTLEPDALARRIAWRDGRLEFHDTPLRDIVAEFNRYHRQQLVIRDAPTGAVPVGGSFAIENLDGFVRLLEAGFGVATVSRDAERIVLEVKP